MKHGILFSHMLTVCEEMAISLTLFAIGIVFKSLGSAITCVKYDLIVQNT